VVLGEAMAEVAYQAYERLLLEEVKKGPIPRHVAIIMDGNRRFARLFGMDSIEGHRKGREKLEEVLEWCRDLGIRILTVYAFSTENFKRREEEVRYIMDMLRDGLYRVADDERTHRYRIRVRVIGRKHLLPEDVRKAAEYAEERTKDYSDFHLNLAVAYGGRQEIVDAIKKIAEKVKSGELDVEDIDEDVVRQHLYTEDLPDPDLILRTSGEERISNFLLWQSAYSELYFSDIYWPNFRKLDFLRAIRDYQRRERRYGR